MRRIVLDLKNGKRVLHFPVKLCSIGYLAENYYSPKLVSTSLAIISFFLKSNAENAHIILNGKKVTINFPWMLIVQAGDLFEIHIDKPWEELFFTISTENMMALEQSGIMPGRYNFNFTISQYFERRKDELISQFMHFNTPGVLDRIDMLAYQLFSEAMLPQPVLHCAPSSYPSVALIMEYLYTHYSKKIDLGKLLRQHGISRRTFYREWKKICPVSPLQFQMEQKINFARNLLRSTPQLTLDEIAENAGFPSIVDFHRNFKKHTDLTPTQYRRQFASLPENQGRTAFGAHFSNHLTDGKTHRRP